MIRISNTTFLSSGQCNNAQKNYDAYFSQMVDVAKTKEIKT